MGRTVDLTVNDPEVGSKVALPDKDLFGRKIDTKLRSLLIFAGSCSNCSADAVNPYRIRHSPFEQRILIYGDDPANVMHEVAKPEPETKVVADSDGAIVRSLGAASFPRFYIVKDGVLVDVWKRTETWPASWTGEVSH